MAGRCGNILFIIKAILVTIVVSISAYGEGTPDGYMSSLSKGMQALDHGHPDSAITFFIQSYSHGLPKDSLFYFWAEALLHKGELDSALAANFIATGSRNDTFRMQARIQRITIYKLLKWEEEAEKLLDTVRTSVEFQKISAVPDVEIGITVGYGREHRGSDTAMPWGTGAGTSFYSDEEGVFGKADIRTTWTLLKGKRSLSAGVHGIVSYRQYTPGALQNAADSTDITGSVFGTVHGKKLSSTGAIALNRRIDDSLFIRGIVEGGYIGNGRFMPMLFGGAATSLGMNRQVSSTRFWMFTMATYTAAPCCNISGSVFSNAYVAPTTSFGFAIDSAAKILYAEDGRLHYPVFYTDSTYSEAIDTSGHQEILGTIPIQNAIYASGRDTILFLGLRQPFSNLLLNPRIAMKIESKLPLQVGVSWRGNFYWEKYEWDELEAYSHYLIYSRSDDSYYYIPEDMVMRSLMVTHGDNRELVIAPEAKPGKVITHRTMRRIDNALAGDLSLQVFTGRYGTGILRVSGSRTWSTLLNKAPVEITEWTVSASFEWRIKYIAHRLYR